MDDTKVAIVTGASSGIGLETSLALGRKGYALVLGARNVQRLNEATRRCTETGAEAIAVPTDVVSEEQVNTLVNTAVQRFGRVDVMVNNAGYGLFARVHEITDKEMRDIFDVNYFGVFYGCKAVAPIMMRQKGGHIFNVSSVLGKRGAPFHGGYCATKFAVCGLTDAIRIEMKPYNVRVTCVCPTLTETNFFQHSRVARRAESTFHRFARRMPPTTVARKIATTVGKPTPELVFSVGGRFLALLSAAWPRAADTMMRLYHHDLAKALEE